MAITYLGNRGSATGTSPLSGLVTIQPTSEVIAGDLLVITVASLAGIVPANIDDTQGNEWQVDASALNTSRVAICSTILANELTPADTITLRVGISLLYCLDLEEFAQVETPQFGATATATGAGTALTTGSVSGAGTNVAIGAWAINAAQASFTPSTGIAFGIVSQTGLALVGSYNIASTAQNPQGTAGTTGTWAGAAADYLPGSDSPEIFGPPAFLTR